MSVAGEGSAGRAGARAERVARLLSVGVCVMLVLLLGRIAQLKADPGARLDASLDARVSHQSLDGARGELRDRRGRVLSTTRFGYRVIVDPEAAGPRADEVIVSLSEALSLSPGEVGGRLMNALIENDRRRELLAKPEAQPSQSLLSSIRQRLGLEQTTPTAQVVNVAHDESPEDEAGEAPKRLIRYLPMGGELTLEQGEMVRALNLPGVWLERRPIREYAGGADVAPIVGKVGLADRSLDQTGLIGAERTLDKSLQARDGRAAYMRDAWGRPLWIEQGAWQNASAGESVRLSIDLELQRIATEELRKGVEAADAAGGRLVMLDPRSGEVLAMVDILRDVPGAKAYPWLVKDEATGKWVTPEGQTPLDPHERTRYLVERPDPGRQIHPALGRNRCVEDLYEPGSTFKPFVWSVAMEKGLLGDHEIIENHANHYVTQCGRAVEDVTHRNELTWDDVLKYSSNVGMAHLSERLSFAQLHEGVVRFGFGSRTGVGLSGESTGIVTPMSRWSKYSQTYVAIGHEIGVTPIQMVRAFSCFARNGELSGTMPRVALVAGDGDAAIAGLTERVLQPEVALRARSAMVGVAERLDEKIEQLHLSEAPKYSMFGKSGTAQIPCVPPPGLRRPAGTSGYFQNQYNSSFIAGAPFDAPRIVVLCVIDDPGPGRIRIRQHYGSYVAGPVVRRVVERSLAYMGVEPDMPDGEQAVVAQGD
ncbi:MAG: penicillin-binding protein 2 [Phycisphaerales bacterium]